MDIGKKLANQVSKNLMKYLDPDKYHKEQLKKLFPKRKRKLAKK